MAPVDHLLDSVGNRGLLTPEILLEVDQQSTPCSLRTPYGFGEASLNPYRASNTPESVQSRGIRPKSTMQMVFQSTCTIHVYFI